MVKKEPSNIKEYYEGQSIFITGSTGTLGKVLVEKILRCCPGVERIYLLIREKKNIPIEERWKKITELALFDVLKESDPKALDKVILIRGDLKADEMGLAEKDKQHLVENVTMIYHMAAMVHFTDSMTKALSNNTKATYMLLNFARRIKKLQLFLYVSTAFCNMNVPCDEAVEEVIPATIDWQIILKLLETQPSVLDTLKEKLLCDQPNPYIWSKWLSEQIVNEYRIYYPTVIVRPAAVICALRDPFPAWLDTINGLFALLQVLSLGVLRVVYTTWDSYQDYIPADAAINAMIVASWKKYIEPAPERTDVYNCCMVKDITLNIMDYKRFGRAAVKERPSKHILWPSRVIVTTNELIYKIFFIIIQVVPAALVDIFFLIRKKKRRAMKLTIKLANMLRVYKKFSAAQLGFPNDKYKALNDVIPKEDWDTFNTVYKDVTNEDIIKLSYESVKKYYFKEETDEESVIKNKRRFSWLLLMDQILVFCFWTLGALFLSKVIISMLPL